MWRYIMKKRMIIWFGILLSLLLVACSGVDSPAPEPEAAVGPLAVQVEPITESPTEEPDVEDEPIQGLAPEVTLPDGDGNMVNLGAMYWRNPDGNGNMVNLGAIYWRNPDGNSNMVNLGAIYWRNPDGDGNMVNLGTIYSRNMD